MGSLDYDVELRKIICSTNTVESLNARYRRAVPASRHPLAGPTGRGQPRWLARCLYDHRDHSRKAPAPAARRSTATKPTVTPPTTKPARHRDGPVFASSRASMTCRFPT
jgi:hypothetical protein